MSKSLVNCSRDAAGEGRIHVMQASERVVEQVEVFEHLAGALATALVLEAANREMQSLARCVQSPRDGKTELLRPQLHLFCNAEWLAVRSCSRFATATKISTFA